MVDREDVRDADFVDSVELAADGTSVYKTGITVASTTNSSSEIAITTTGPLNLDGFIFGDNPVEVGDTIVLSGTTGGADGSYTIATIIDNNTVTVSGSIPDSTGGTASVRHPTGASRVGVDSTSISSSTATNLQSVLEDLDSVISAGGITESQHKALRDLIHLADDDGPMDGFTSGAFEETLPAGNPFPTSYIWYEDNTKTNKIIETQVEYFNNVFLGTVSYLAYDTDGSTVLVTLRDVYDYSPGILTPTRTRTWST